jgi:Fe2+ transport system protein FeoA
MPVAVRSAQSVRIRYDAAAHGITSGLTKVIYDGIARVKNEIKEARDAVVGKRWSLPSCNSISIGLVSIAPVAQPQKPNVVIQGNCLGGSLCPLSRVEEGSVVCIKQLATSPALSDRLRELGFCEEQKIRLLARDSNFICQVCNARLGISQELADAILVEPVSV